MRQFPHEFANLLSPRGLRILLGKSPTECGLFARSNRRFASFSNLIPPKSGEVCMRLLDDYLYDSLSVEQRRIPAESITEMKENYSEILNKTMHIKTAFFRKKTAR